MKRLAFPVAVLAILGAIAFWWFSPVQIVKRRTAKLLATLTLEEGSGKGPRQMRVYSLNALLAPEVELKAPSMEEANGTFERSEMESAFSWLCEQAKLTRFDLDKITSVRIEGDTADVTCSLEALVELPTYRPADGFYDAAFRWQRGDDGWRLSSATWTEATK